MRAQSSIRKRSTAITSRIMPRSTMQYAAASVPKQYQACTDCDPWALLRQFLDKLKKSGLGDISQGEAKFYYFSSFDTNADEHLDGTELRSALLDYEYDEKTTMQDVEDAVDAILMEDDVDNECVSAPFPHRRQRLLTLMCLTDNVQMYTSRSGKISWKEYLASESIHEQISPEN
ncbi:hypothetical protein BCR44DRAFT_34963 [Catenaria anguillulae PL171]|uniref:EF-hand domain-containing protein n=1 Tax=Catenaria anguillulae PL171 TaxID=765915 RepID=A0A1Y2HWC7_9FUNG|nr:hypothetical protein BCR44DRAFT_34963 [Catenaria anguillulae PL171]